MGREKSEGSKGEEKKRGWEVRDRKGKSLGGNVG